MSLIYINKGKRQGKLLSFPVLSFCLSIWILLFFSGSCHYYHLEQKLPPDDAEWLNKVRYIITSKERKLFLDLPNSEREQFKEEFWKRRDPDPGTEENEFKMEYFGRLEKASELFRGESRPGWLTDRGRIYILFGPPMDRLIYNEGLSATCQERWYYGAFPVVFIDRTCTGRYELVTYNLTALRDLNMRYMNALNQAQARAQQTIQGQAEFFNFDWKISADMVQPDRVEGRVQIEVPYANIWFKEEDEKMITVLDLGLAIKNAVGDLVWEYSESYRVETSEEELQESRGLKYKIEIPFVIDKDVDKLQKGQNKIYATLTNRTGDSKLRKVLAFSL